MLTIDLVSSVFIIVCISAFAHKIMLADEVMRRSNKKERK